MFPSNILLVFLTLISAKWSLRFCFHRNKTARQPIPSAYEKENLFADQCSRCRQSLRSQKKVSPCFFLWGWGWVKTNHFFSLDRLRSLTLTLSRFGGSSIGSPMLSYTLATGDRPAAPRIDRNLYRNSSPVPWRFPLASINHFRMSSLLSWGQHTLIRRPFDWLMNCPRCFNSWTEIEFIEMRSRDQISE